MNTSRILEAIKKSGLRTTRTRTRIIELFNQSRHPLTASDLLKYIDVNKTTIYREIETLVTHGFIAGVDLGDGNKRYELASLDHHHHLVCIKCRSVADFTLNDDFSKEEKQISSEKQFTVLKHNLEFFGICHNCNSL